MDPAAPNPSPARQPSRQALRLVTPLPRSEPPRVLEPSLEPESVYRRYSPYVAAIAARLLGREADVDDAVQEVFVQALRGLHTVREPGAVKGWLARITVRVSHRKLKMRRLRRFLGSESAAVDGLVHPSASPEQRAQLAQAYEALDRLPANLRVAWILRHFDGQRLHEVARLSGCSLATAKRRIASAEQRLDEVLNAP